MSSRRQNKQTSESETDQSLPLWNGTQIDAPDWLRELEAGEHLLDADVAFFLQTGCVVVGNGKTAVASYHQSALLQLDLISTQKYNVLNPPPVDLKFTKLYDDVRAEVVKRGVTAEISAFPATPSTALPDNHILAPDRIMQINLKLRNVILSLITSRGRKRYYQDLTQSGTELLRHLIKDSKSVTNQFQQSPHTMQMKAKLQQLKNLTLSQPSQIEFDEIRDSIEEINEQLENKDRMTSNQLCDHYISLVTGLNSTPLWLALQMELRVAAVKYGDVTNTVQCITRVLTNFISHELAVAELSSANRNKNRAFTAGANKNKDPSKTGLQRKGPPTTPCPFCKKMHWGEQCFQNPNANDSTKKLALRIAPKSPAALWLDSAQHYRSGIR